MNSLQVSLKLLTDEGQVAKSHRLTIQYFILASARWTNLGTVTTNNAGMVSQTFRPPVRSTGTAPLLRVIEAGAPAPRVVTEGGFVSYIAQSKTLVVDFGVIERLEETAYARAASASRFNRSKLTVAGQAQRGQVTQPMMIRAMTLSNPAVAGRVASVDAVRARGESSSARPVTPAITNVANLNVELARFTAREVELKTENELQRVAIKSRDDELSATRSKLADAESRLSRAETENATFRAQVASQRPIQEVAAAIGGQLHQANQKMRTERHGFRLGKVQLNLKGIVSADGGNITMPSHADLKDQRVAGALQGVTVDLEPAQTTASGNEVQVPDVTGLTETAVRRVLNSVGLRLEIITEVVAGNRRIAVGQSFLQAPKAGAGAERGSSVLVTFAGRELQE